ncbi:hypothetical protein AGMMS50268_06810 [Spirochaetia bacterium]|nr:hypothetical protein AGMMS50268_06810 [Spirochaetia bacterium]
MGPYAWYYVNSGAATHEVKTRAANSANLYDMNGNVYEWCWDIYSGTRRVRRGGSWDLAVSFCQVSDRNPSTIEGGPGSTWDYVGFRVVCP